MKHVRVAASNRLSPVVDDKIVFSVYALGWLVFTSSVCVPELTLEAFFNARIFIYRVTWQALFVFNALAVFEFAC
jgi:hypothetical protein